VNLFKMDRPDPQKQKHSLFDEIKSSTKEAQVDLKRPKNKRSSQQAKDEDMPPAKRRAVSLDDEQRRLEARRASNRLSAQRSRHRQKTVIKGQDKTIQELENDVALLQRINNTLCTKLDEALRQQHQLMRMMRDEVPVALGRNLALQCAFECRIEDHSIQCLSQGFPREVTPPLLHLTGAASALSFESPHLSRSSVVENGQDLVSNHIQEQSTSGKERSSRNDTSIYPSYASLIPSRLPPVCHSGQVKSPLSANAQGGVADSVQIQYLQQEIKALKEKTQAATEKRASP